MAVVSICVWSGEWGWVKEFMKERNRAEFCGYANGLLDEARRIDNGEWERERRGESKPVSSHYTWRRGTKKRFKCFFEEISQRNEILFRVVVFSSIGFLSNGEVEPSSSWLTRAEKKSNSDTRRNKKMLQGFVIGRRIEITSAFFYDRKLIFRRPCTLALLHY